MKVTEYNQDQLAARGTDDESVTQSILKERGSTYGDSSVNLTVTENMMDAFINGQVLSGPNQQICRDTMENWRAHQAAIRQIIYKLGRIATGIPHEDNYNDIIGYAKIAKRHGKKIR